MATDTTIIAIGLTFFLILGFVIPFANTVYNTEYEAPDTSVADTSAEGSNVVTILDVLFSVLTISFWSLSGIPVWLNLLLFIPRFIFWFAVAVKIIHG